MDRKVRVKLNNIHKLFEYCCFKQMIVCRPEKTCVSQREVRTDHSPYLSFICMCNFKLIYLPGVSRLALSDYCLMV